MSRLRNSSGVFLLGSLAAFIALTVGCAQTFAVKGDYAPRLSPEGQSIKKSISAKKEKPVFEVMPFKDERTRKVKPKCATGGKRCTGVKARPKAVPMEPNLIFVGNGIGRYEINDKTVAEFLRSALVFDLNRFGFSVVQPVSLPKGTENKASELRAAPAKYTVHITVYTFEPDIDIGFASVTPSYVYDYRVVVIENETNQTVLDEQVKMSREGLPVPSLTFSEATDVLMNVNLTPMNVAVAEKLVQFE